MSVVFFMAELRGENHGSPYERIPNEEAEQYRSKLRASRRTVRAGSPEIACPIRLRLRKKDGMIWV